MRRFLHRCGMALAAWALILVVLPGAASAQELLFDWSPHRIQITSDFTGAPVIVFGVVDGPGDVIVVVRGPTDSVSVRRKRRFAGIWINRDEVEFDDVPAYYAVASGRPLNEILSEETAKRRSASRRCSWSAPTATTMLTSFARPWWSGARRRVSIAASPAA
jgi:uncharacterized protein (TIGR02186 family)